MGGKNHVCKSKEVGLFIQITCSGIRMYSISIIIIYIIISSKQQLLTFYHRHIIMHSKNLWGLRMYQHSDAHIAVKSHCGTFNGTVHTPRIFRPSGRCAAS